MQEPALGAGAGAATGLWCAGMFSRKKQNKGKLTRADAKSRSPHTGVSRVQWLLSLLPIACRSRFMDKLCSCCCSHPEVVIITFPMFSVLLRPRILANIAHFRRMVKCATTPPLTKACLCLVSCGGLIFVSLADQVLQGRAHAGSLCGPSLQLRQHLQGWQCLFKNAAVGFWSSSCHPGAGHAALSHVDAWIGRLWSLQCTTLDKQK